MYDSEGKFAHSPQVMDGLINNGKQNPKKNEQLKTLMTKHQTSFHVHLLLDYCRCYFAVCFFFEKKKTTDIWGKEFPLFAANN